MRKAFRRAACSFVAAGTLAGVPPALAQTSPYLLSNPAARGVPATVPGRPLPPAVNSTAVPIEPSARLAEIQVELAWLSDPVTYPFPLTAHAFGSNLELRGSVPNEVVRAHAAQIAREHCGLMIADGVQVQPGLRMAGPAKETSEGLARAASAVLNEALPLYASGLEVRAQAQGLLTLRGPVPSYEEKLLASQRLRRLRGCTAIDNQLEVLVVHHDGKPYVAVSADGSQLALFDVKNQRPVVTMAPARPVPVSMPAPIPAPRPQIATVVTTAAVKAEAPKMTPAVKVEPPKPTVAVNVELPKPSAVAKVEPPKPAPPTASDYGISRVVHLNTEHPSPPKPPAAPAPPAALAPSPPRQPSTPPKPALATPPPRIVSQDALLCQRIEACCGGGARNVSVSARPGNCYLVRMTVSDSATGERLGHQIFAMPELTPYQVNLEIRIAK
jgi:hypothetical protein